MLYKLKGTLKDEVSFSFNKLKHIKFGEIGLDLDIYISRDDNTKHQLKLHFYLRPKNYIRRVPLTLNQSLQ